jgi:DNA polymerase-3 subunit alpha
MYQARSTLKELAIALDIPVWATEAIADQAEKTSLKEAMEGSKFLAGYAPSKHVGWPQDFKREATGYAIQMEDHPKHAGQHAAGVVITSGPVADVVAVDRRTGATMCDKYDAEVLGLLKIDALGLTQLSVFEDALWLVGNGSSYVEWPMRGPFNDPKAFHILNTRRFAGVFQFNGPALQNLCTKVTVKSLDDMVALTALARPGPLDSGEAHRWIQTRTGYVPQTYPHPLFEPILKPTLGVVIYQEQVMQICRAVGMSWEEVSAVRRLISKSAGPEELERYHESFYRNGIAHDINESVSNDVWRILRASGSYSFNKSHAVAYSIISYWCCWMKAHYPLEFAAATLTHAGEEMQLKLLRELAKEGTRYVPADSQLSTDKWTVAERNGARTLIGPLSNIIGIGPQHQKTILSARVRKVERIPDHIGKILYRMKTKVDDLWPIKSAIERLKTDKLKQDLVSKCVDIGDIQSTGAPYVVRVEGLVDSIKKINENAPDRVIKRNGRTLPGTPHAINLWIGDDTDKIFAKVDYQAFADFGEELLAHGKGYYSLRGLVPADFRMIKVEKFRFIGTEGAPHAETIAAE